VVDALIQEANYRGGLDNITAIVIQVNSAEDGARGVGPTPREMPAVDPTAATPSHIRNVE
jgi:serine/threonine protein phosphatase PrpC